MSRLGRAFPIRPHIQELLFWVKSIDRPGGVTLAESQPHHVTLAESQPHHVTLAESQPHHVTIVDSDNS